MYKKGMLELPLLPVTERELCSLQSQNRYQQRLDTYFLCQPSPERLEELQPGCRICPCWQQRLSALVGGCEGD